MPLAYTSTLKPFGALILSSGSLSAAAASGGAGTGASFCAPGVSGRPMSGEPGGNGAAGCCAAAGQDASSSVPRVPASTRPCRRDQQVMSYPPCAKADLGCLAGPRLSRAWRDRLLRDSVSDISPPGRNRFSGRRPSIGARAPRPGWDSRRARCRRRSASRHAAAVVADAVVPAGIVVGDQQRTVLHDFDVDRTPDIGVVLQEAGQERLPGFHAAVGVELRHDDVAADLGGLVPGAVARDEDRVAIRGREHAAGIEAHPERPGMWADQRDRRLEFAARAPPTELVVGHVTLMAIRVAEVLPGLGHPVELVVGDVL